MSRKVLCQLSPIESIKFLKSELVAKPTAWRKKFKVVTGCDPVETPAQWYDWGLELIGPEVLKMDWRHVADLISSRLTRKKRDANQGPTKKRKPTDDDIAVSVHLEYRKFSESFLADNPHRQKAKISDGFRDWVKDNTDLPNYPDKKLTELNKRGCTILARQTETRNG